MPVQSALTLYVPEMDSLRVILPLRFCRKDLVHLAVAVKDLIAREGERELIIALDFNSISGEQIGPVKRGLRALRWRASRPWHIRPQ